MLTNDTNPLCLDFDEFQTKVLLKIQADFGLPSDLSRETLIDSAFIHHFSSAGKQTRSTLAVEACSSLGLDTKVAVSLAACIESLHNASLVQDDLQDRALERRGLATVHSLFGQDAALGLATRLISTAYVSLSGIGSSVVHARLVRRIHEAVGETVLGQTRDLNPNEDRSVSSLLEIARQKSGPLFALALELPLIVADHDSVLQSAREAACCFGLGYQIIDDLKDQQIDRLQPADANIVNALENECGPKQAVAKARNLAETELRASARLAVNLPSSSGKLLCSMAEGLLAELRTSHG